MSREIQADHTQVFLLPPAIEEWVPADHPARFIREFVDSLNLEELGFKVRRAEVGRPNYSAAHLLKVWLYGYLQRIRSTRKLERACREHMSLIWLTGMQAPDHNTLWRFFNENQQALKAVFKQTILVANSAELVGMVVHAVDGTKIRARSSRRGAWHQKDLQKMLARVDASIAEMVEEVKAGERSDEGGYRLPEELQDKQQLKGKIQAALTELEAAQAEHLHPLEPDARMMKTGRTVEFAYNAQAVVDEASGLVVACDVTNDVNDERQLVPMLDAVKETLGDVAEETLADGGYASAASLQAAIDKHYEVLVNLGQHKGEYHSSKFRYDEANDTVICPKLQPLTYQRTKKSKNGEPLRVYHCRGYKECPVRWQCSQNKRGRTIELVQAHRAIAAQKAKQQSAEKAGLLKMRQQIAELPFAITKEHLGFTRWVVRGLEKTKVQWALICTTLNLSKLYRYWTEEKLRFRRV